MHNQTSDIKVALVHPHYRPDGGAEKAVVHTLNALARKGMQVSIISRHWAEDGRDIQLLQCNPFYIGRLWREWSFARKAAHILSAMDVDIIQSQIRLPGCHIYRAGGGVHREWLRQRDRISSPLRRFLTRLSAYHGYKQMAERKLYADPRLKAVICNSYMVAKEIVDYFQLPPEKIHVIYNSVELDKFHINNNLALRQSFRTRLGFNKNHIVFLFVGSGFERKGLSILLDCMAELPKECRLMVVGDDESAWKYARKSRKLGITQRVLFFGMQKDVIPYFAAADAFVLPTLYDAFANSVLEAMASSLPVITSLKCGAVDLIKNGENGFVCDSLDKPKLLECMHKLRDFDTSRAIGQAGRKTIEGFTNENMSHRLYSLYEKILSH